MTGRAPDGLAAGPEGDRLEALRVARAAVLEAGDLVRAAWLEGAGSVGSKAVAIDLVTATDKASDALLVERIRGAFPEDELVIEETGVHEGGSGCGRRWYVDPLDGTTNFAHGLPHFAVTAALEIEGVIEVAATLDVTRGHLYEAILGGGAWVAGPDGSERTLRVSATEGLPRALLATGFPYDRHTASDDNTAESIAFLKTCRGLRRAGAAALDLAYVARGWFDGYWEMRLNPWDVAAGMLLVTEAGGRATGYAGEPMDVRGGRYVASNGKIHDEMLAVLHGVRQEG